MELTDLIKRCQNGETESFGDLYRLYGQKALGTAYLIAGRKGIAEDIVQEAFIQCFKDIKKLQSPGAFEVWFYKILVRTGVNMAVKCGRMIPVDEDCCERVSHWNGLSPGMESSETSLVVREALERLSLPLRAVVILHYFNDMPVKEISKVLGCFQGTVKSRLHKARKLLQKILGEDSVGSEIGFKAIERSAG